MVTSVALLSNQVCHHTHSVASITGLPCNTLSYPVPMHLLGLDYTILFLPMSVLTRLSCTAGLQRQPIIVTSLNFIIFLRVYVVRWRCWAYSRLFHLKSSHQRPISDLYPHIFQEKLSPRVLLFTLHHPLSASPAPQDHLSLSQHSPPSSFPTLPIFLYSEHLCLLKPRCD